MPKIKDAIQTAHGGWRKMASSRVCRNARNKNSSGSPAATKKQPDETANCLNGWFVSPNPTSASNGSNAASHEKRSMLKPNWVSEYLNTNRMATGTMTISTILGSGVSAMGPQT